MADVESSRCIHKSGIEEFTTDSADIRGDVNEKLEILTIKAYIFQSRRLPTFDCINWLTNEPLPGLLF